MGIKKEKNGIQKYFIDIKNWFLVSKFAVFLQKIQANKL